MTSFLGKLVKCYYTVEYMHHPFGHIILLYDNGFIEMLEIGREGYDDIIVDYTIGKYMDG